MTNKKLAALAALAVLSVTPAGAQEAYKIGISAGLTGYAATVDRGWRDGVEVAAAALNAKGGIMGRKIEVITEDNKSEPQEAVTVYRKMISDKADIFLSGCVSAGNFAGAPLTVRAQDPDGALFDPAAERRPREMGVQHLAAGRFRGLDPPFVSQGQNPGQKDRRAARSVALCGSAEEHRREDRSRLWPGARWNRTVQAGRRRSQRADQQDACGRRPRGPQDRPWRHHADSCQEHQASSSASTC